MFIFKRLSFLSFHKANPGRTSDICVRCFHLGLDLGRTGNFPWTGGDGSLLAASCPIAAGVLDATAWSSGIFFIYFFGWAVVFALPMLLLPFLSAAPPAQGAAVDIRARPLPVCLGIGFLSCCLLLSPFVLLVTFTGCPAFVSAICGSPLLHVGLVLILVPPVSPFRVGRAGLLARWTPWALGLHLVLGALPRAGGAVVPLSLGPPLFAHILLGSPVSSLCFSRAGGALRLICPALSGFHGTRRLGVAPACFSGLGAWAGGTPLVLVRELLSSWSVSLPAMLITGTRRPRCTGIPPGEPFGGCCLWWRGRLLRGWEGDWGWRGWRWLPVRCRKSGKAWGWNGYFVLQTWGTTMKG